MGAFVKLRVADNTGRYRLITKGDDFDYTNRNDVRSAIEDYWNRVGSSSDTITVMTPRGFVRLKYGENIVK